MTTSPEGRKQRKLSFLEDQAYREELERRDAEAAAASNSADRTSLLDYALFGYFCINCFLLGGPLFNSNAVVHVWKKTDTFVSECSTFEPPTSWCPEQAAAARVALLLFQSTAGATSMIGGALVDAFSGAMCLLIAHIMFGAGAYFLQSPGTRGIYAACFLQGAAGELLLNSVLPICGLFGKLQNVMLLILTVFHDLSVLIFPLVITFLAPQSTVSTVHEEFFTAYHTVYFYVTIVAGVVGMFILPPDDDLCRTPSTIVAATASVPTAAHFEQQQFVTAPLTTTGHADDEFSVLLAQGEKKQSWGANGFCRRPKSLWRLRLSRQLRTPQFFIAVMLFALSLLRASFFLNNNQELMSFTGDDGKLSWAFMWMLGLGAVCSPVSWYINDNWGTVPCLFLFTCSMLAVNILAWTRVSWIQYMTIFLFVFSRAAISPTLLTYIAHCFGYRRFPAMSVIVGLLGAFFNFTNVLLDSLVRSSFRGDYNKLNVVMIGVGVFCVGVVFLQVIFPTAQSPPQESENIDVASKTISAPTGRLRQSILVADGGLLRDYNDDIKGAVVDEDDWEDETVVDGRQRL